MANNGYFRSHDPNIHEMAGWRFDPNWWSRPYEYAWAIEYVERNHIVADMGCGWHYRPFKDALAEKCQFVFAVDADARLLNLEQHHYKAPNLEFIVADITKRITRIADRSLDRVFCISVLEDLGDVAGPAFMEFKRVLKDNGRIILTHDAPYDTEQPTPVYPGLPLGRLRGAMQEAGLEFDGEVDHGKDNALHHKDWNLCVFHSVLKKA